MTIINRSEQFKEHLDERQLGGETKREFKNRIERYWHLLEDKYLAPTPELIDKTYDLTKDYHLQTNDRIMAIHNWINSNIPYELIPLPKSDQDKYNRNYRYKTASETFRKGTGICVDVSFLFQSMAIISGNHTTRVVIDKEHCYNHSFGIGQNGTYIDCTRADGFGIIPQKKHVILEREQAKELYNEFCLNFNEGLIEKAINKYQNLLGNNYDLYSYNQQNNYDTQRVLPAFNTRKVLPYAALITGLLWTNHNVRDFTQKMADEITTNLNHIVETNLFRR